MPHGDPVGAARALYRTMPNRKNHCVALRQRHDLGAGLHAGALFRQDKLAAGKINAGPRQQNGHL